MPSILSELKLISLILVFSVFSLGKSLSLLVNWFILTFFPVLLILLSVTLIVLLFCCVLLCFIEDSLKILSASLISPNLIGIGEISLDLAWIIFDLMLLILSKSKLTFCFKVILLFFDVFVLSILVNISFLLFLLRLLLFWIFISSKVNENFFFLLFFNILFFLFFLLCLFVVL